MSTGLRSDGSGGMLQEEKKKKETLPMKWKRQYVTGDWRTLSRESSTAADSVFLYTQVFLRHIRSTNNANSVTSAARQPIHIALQFREPRGASAYGSQIPTLT